MPAPAKRKPSARRAAPKQTGLARYHAKRDLRASGEPADGVEQPLVGAVRRFVIQKHDATRLHYDLRLEMAGVYRSWAVPKGLPTEPGQRHLAVEVEDHPLEYGTFEGVIPPGNYGAGTVMLWDRGHYAVLGGEPERAYRDGKLHVALSGEKCVGEWTLVRLPKRDGETKTNWLALKNTGPAHPAPRSRAERDVSVLSGRSLDEIAQGAPPAARRGARAKEPAAARGRNLRQARGSARRAAVLARPPVSTAFAPAEFIAPMKALAVDEVPTGDWRLEIKLDGYRAIAVINQGEVELWSRNHKPLTPDYPEVIAALKKIGCANAVLDGEIVALDEKGRSRFQLLQNRGETRPTLAYYVFDLLHHDGRSLLQMPLEERRTALEALIGRGLGPVQVSPVFAATPQALLREVRKQGLEGIIAKQSGSAYEPDRRSGSWLKCKVHGEQEFVIGGFTPPKNTRAHFGAILIGYYEGGKLKYAGKVGSGFDAKLLASLHQEFRRLRVDTCPFADLPSTRRSRFGSGMTASVMKEVTWVRPELVAQVQFTEWTDEGALRHPVFLGLRHDKAAHEVVREPAGRGR